MILAKSLALLSLQCMQELAPINRRLHDSMSYTGYAHALHVSKRHKKAGEKLTTGLAWWTGGGALMRALIIVPQI